MPFKAYFEHGSSAELTVQPSSGELTADGTMFVVSYKPRSYGRNPTGKLVVEVGDTVA